MKLSSGIYNDYRVVCRNNFRNSSRERSGRSCMFAVNVGGVIPDYIYTKRKTSNVVASAFLSVRLVIDLSVGSPHLNQPRGRDSLCVCSSFRNRIISATPSRNRLFVYRCDITHVYTVFLSYVWHYARVIKSLEGLNQICPFVPSKQ